MALKTGLDAQWAIIEETTWGTYLAPDRFLAFLSEGIALTDERIEGASSRAGDRVMSEDEWASNAKGASGSSSFEIGNMGFGKLFKAMLGDVTITTPTSGTLTRDHTHVLGDLDLGYTIQVGRPDTGGTVRPFSYTGCKVVDWTISQDIDALAKRDINWDAHAETTAQGLETASYTANTIRYPFQECSITVGGTELCVNSFSLSGTTNLATDRYRICSTGNKREQLQGGVYEITGEIVPDFEDLDEYNYFVNGTENQMIITWTNADANSIESGFAHTLTITLPVVRWDGSTPSIDDTGVVDVNMPFKVLADSAGANEPMTLVYRTSDTAS